MVNGRTGRVGDHAALRAVVEHRQGQGRAAIHHHLATVLLAVDLLQSLQHATPNVVVRY